MVHFSEHSTPMSMMPIKAIKIFSIITFNVEHIFGPNLFPYQEIKSVNEYVRLSEIGFISTFSKEKKAFFNKGFHLQNYSFLNKMASGINFYALILQKITLRLLKVSLDFFSFFFSIFHFFFTVTIYFVVLPISNVLASWRNGIASDFDMSGTLPLP